MDTVVSFIENETLLQQKIAMRFDTEKLVADLGGPALAAKITGLPRTSPYRWLKSGTVSAATLAAIKAARPDIEIDSYFIEEKESDRHRRGSCRSEGDTA